MLGRTPLALVLLYSANLLFRLPRSPLGREPLYLQQRKGDRKFTVSILIEFFFSSAARDVCNVINGAKFL